MLSYNIINGKRILQKVFQLVEIDHVRTVGKGFLRIVVDLHEQRVDAGADGGAGQILDILAVARGRRAETAGNLHAVSRVEDHRIAEGAHDRRKSIDEAIALSLTLEEFKSELKIRGYNYRFDPQRKYWTITPPGWKKPIRIHQLGENYTRESIERRIYENDPSVRAERVRQNYHRSNQYNLRRRIDRIMGRSGLEKLYLRYCYELGYLPKYQQNTTKLHILLKEDLLKCDQYSEQAKILSKYHVDTDEDLSQLMEKLERKMQSASAERDEMRKVSRRNIPIAQIDAARDKVTELTAELRDLRKELKVCRQVQERSDHIRENIETIDRERQREKVR